jgi:hypothetical protein
MRDKGRGFGFLFFLSRDSEGGNVRKVLVGSSYIPRRELRCICSDGKIALAKSLATSRYLRYLGC